MKEPIQQGRGKPSNAAGLSSMSEAEAAQRVQKVAQMSPLASQSDEQADIQAEALRRLKVRQLSSGRLAPTPQSSPSQSNTPPQTE